MKTAFSAALMATILAAAAPAHATLSNAPMIVNGSFEQSVTLNSGSWTTLYTNGATSGWISGTAGYEVRNGVAGTAKDGKNFVELDTNQNSSISQTIKTTLGQTYNLSFWYAPRAGVAADSNGIDVLWNGTSILTSPLTGTSSNWVQQTLAVTGTGGLDKLSFLAVGNSDSYGGSIDMVSLTAAVPEPETYAMLLAGLGLMGTVARRRRSAKD